VEPDMDINNPTV